MLSNIENGNIPPGERLPSESELMKRFEVSRNSIRQAINGLISEKYLYSRQGIGTFCLKRSSSKSMLIALISLRLNSYIFPKIINGCDRVLSSNGYQLLINQSRYNLDEERKILEDLKSKQVDGIIITPVSNHGEKNNADLIRSMEAQGIPIVLLDNEYKDYNFSSVLLNDYEAGKLAAEYLISQGHKKIGVLFSENYTPKVNRKNGVASYLKEFGLPVLTDWIIGIEGQTSGYHTYRQIRRIFDRKKELPTAMVCSSDDESLIFMHHAEKRGIKIPDDISIISFDNSEIAKHTHPRLTSMNHPSEYLGKLAVYRLLEKINHQDIKMNSKTLVESYLIKRDSVKKISS